MPTIMLDDQGRILLPVDLMKVDLHTTFEV